jgi:NADH-quinone oxidoreductase subunit M
MQSHILSIILFTPLVGALVLLFVSKENKDAIRWIANIFALGGFLISLPLVPMFWAQRFEPGFKFLEGTPNNWIPSIGAGYNLGIDGISFLLIMLTTLLGWISILSSWTAIEIRVKECCLASSSSTSTTTPLLTRKCSHSASQSFIRQLH